jgi:hypothetical protein
MSARGVVWLLAFALVSLGALCAGIDDLPPAVSASLPLEVRAILVGGKVLTPYVLVAHINPFYLQGDFNGDGKRDTAVLIKSRTSGKVGIAIFLAGKHTPAVVGAGKPIGNGGNDLFWMDAWSVKSKGAVERGMTDEAPPKLRGDALLVEATDSASALIYWTGSVYAWYQQGD